mmetsp:Transcript_14134/g.30155  ORF Transcript_14134/g.30155 Transcript_14134/m.30155 type:complete len:310 (-) Transcript_14134:1246-2175(-)
MLHCRRCCRRRHRSHSHELQLGKLDRLPPPRFQTHLRHLPPNVPRHCLVQLFHPSSTPKKDPICLQRKRSSRRKGRTDQIPTARGAVLQKHRRLPRSHRRHGGLGKFPERHIFANVESHERGHFQLHQGHAGSDPQRNAGAPPLCQIEPRRRPHQNVQHVHPSRGLRIHPRRGTGRHTDRRRRRLGRDLRHHAAGHHDQERQDHLRRHFHQIARADAHPAQSADHRAPRHFGRAVRLHQPAQDSLGFRHGQHQERHVSQRRSERTRFRHPILVGERAGPSQSHGHAHGFGNVRLSGHLPASRGDGPAHR